MPFASAYSLRRLREAQLLQLTGFSGARDATVAEMCASSINSALNAWLRLSYVLTAKARKLSLQQRLTLKQLAGPNNSFKPTPHRGIGHVLYATLARVRHPAAGRLNSGVRPHGKSFGRSVQSNFRIAHETAGGGGRTSIRLLAIF